MGGPAVHLLKEKLQSLWRRPLQIFYPEAYSYFASDNGLGIAVKKAFQPNYEVSFVRCDLETFTNLPDRPYLLTAIHLRRMLPKAELLTGLPMGASLETLTKEMGEYQVYVDRLVAAEGIKLLYLGSVNESYGRFAGSSALPGPTLIGARGLRGQWFAQDGLQPSNLATSHMAYSAGRWISEALPHYYNHKISGTVAFEKYLIDRQSRSPESLFLYIPAKQWQTYSSDEQRLIQDNSHAAAHYFNNKNLNIEKAALAKLGGSFELQEFSLLETSPTFLKNYQAWLETAGERYPEGQGFISRFLLRTGAPGLRQS